jgi:SpoVK/Ycf46/Vps4 family AAA+-type ATPase
VKTQLMASMDGLSNGADDGKLIVVIAATNRPWDLD